MTAFRLAFREGEVTGEGRDIIGPFAFSGVCDVQTGAIILTKQYRDRHRVIYHGKPDGEGCIAGTWSIGEAHTGPFLMRPVLRRLRGDEPIHEIM